MKTTFCDQFKTFAGIVQVLLINSATLIILLNNSFYLNYNHSRYEDNIL